MNALDSFSDWKVSRRLALASLGGVLGCGGGPSSFDAAVAEGPEFVYQHPRPTCPAADRPTFSPPPTPADIPGSPRWVRTLSALSTDNPEMPFTPFGIDSYAGLTGEGTSLWRDGDGNLLALEFVGGGVVRHEIALGIGPYLWLDGFAYGHDGIMVTGQGVCLDGECTGARGVGSPRPPTDFRPDYLTFPAWSPVTGGIVSRSGTDYLFAGCTDGQPHWMLRFPGLDLRGVPAGLFIRASGEILLIANEAYAISPDGEVLRQRTIFTPELGLAATSAATFIEGCGVLLAGQNSFAWLNPDSFEVGPIHTVPGGYPLVSFAATPSCHVVMIANPVTPTLVRVAPDGEVVYATLLYPTRPPFVLADDSVLVVRSDGYDVFDSAGTLVEAIDHDAPLLACSMTQAGLAPDGTLFRVCAGDLPDDPYLTAVPTGHPSAGSFGPSEGLDFARTNSVGD